MRMMLKRKNIKKTWFRKPSSKTSQRMRLIRSSGSGIERVMETLMVECGMEFEKHSSLIGKPDFVIQKSKIAIFCDSSFWHGRRHKEITGEAFKMNRTFWVNKLENNKKRDMKVSRVLRKQGWKVLRFWDTDILKNPLKVRNKLLRGFSQNERTKEE